MANQPETATYDEGVFQLETSTLALGGVDGPANAPLLNLANRTAYLKAHIDLLEAGTSIPDTIARVASPTFTGTPAAPTPSSGDDSTKIATTAFVKAQGYLTSAPVTSVAGKTGVVTLAKADVGLGSVDNTSDAGKPVSTAQQTALNLKANVAAPAFTGQVKLANGSVGTPALGFSGDTNTGLYWISADVMALVVGGNEILRITPTGIVVTGAITATGNISAYV